MHIAQISDSHLMKRGARLFGKIDTCAFLEKTVDRIVRLDPRPDVVIHTGDLTNDGDAADYATVADILGRLPMPVFPILGNHDLRGLARDAFSPLPFRSPSGPFSYVVEDFAVRIVALDSLVEGQAGGRLGSEQISWLDSVLAQRRTAPTLVMLHHPPFDTGLEFMDRIGLSDRADLAAVIAGHDQVLLVAAGHIHRLITTGFAGTVAMTGPGTAHQVSLDLRPGADATWTDEPPGFLLHRFNANRLVSHVVPLDPPCRGAFHDNHTFVGQ